MVASNNEDTRSLVGSESAHAEGKLRAPAGMVHRYILLDTLGAGGSGVVYRAFDPALTRQIAVKLLRAESSRAGTQGERLLREGRAIAQISHPNVVNVYDVGTFEDEVFVAMELLEGPTMSMWLRESHTLDQLLDVFVQGAAGLGAAHARGIVHRDFKPDNAFVMPGGRVVVVDFGLARALDAPADHDEAAPPSPDWDRSLTRPGTAPGTPGYMAPEQLRGEAVDARADQFALCVAMWEALYGERPFQRGHARDELLQIERGPKVPARPRHRVPGWLEQILRRGMAAEVSSRFNDMSSLLAAVARGRIRKTVWKVAAIACTLLIAVLVPLVVSLQRGPACPPATDKLQGIWDSKVERKVGMTLASLKSPLAGQAAEIVGTRLNRYAAGWLKAHQNACTATHVRHEQSESALDLRMGCLEQRRQELRALVRELAAMKAEAPAERAIDALESLRSVTSCEDAQALAAGFSPLPTGRVAQGKQLRSELARAGAVLATGRHSDALPITTKLVSKARKLNHPPLLAEVLLAHGRVLFAGSKFSDARRAFVEAAKVAGLAKHQTVLAAALTAIAYQTARVEVKPSEARSFLPFVEPTVSMLPSRAEERFEFLMMASEVWLDTDDSAQALARLGEARGLFSDTPHTARLLQQTLRVRLYGTNDLEGACAVGKEALSAAIAAYGPNHPKVGEVLVELGYCATATGRLEQALAYLTRGKDILLLTQPPNHRTLAKARRNLADPLSTMGRVQEALDELHAAREAYLQDVGEGAAVRAVDVAIAFTLYLAGRFDEARKMNELVMRAYATDSEAGAAEIATLWSNLGEISLSLGEPSRALEECNKAASYWQRHGPSHPYRAYALHCLGEAHLMLNQCALAVSELEAALSRRERHGTALEIADTRAVLAFALWNSQDTRERALAMANTALRSFEGAAYRTPSQDKRLAKLRVWKAARTGITKRARLK